MNVAKQTMNIQANYIMVHVRCFIIIVVVQSQFLSVRSLGMNNKNKKKVQAKWNNSGTHKQQRVFSSSTLFFSFSGFLPFSLVIFFFGFFSDFFLRLFGLLSCSIAICLSHSIEHNFHKFKKTSREANYSNESCNIDRIFFFSFPLTTAKTKTNRERSPKYSKERRKNAI